MRWNEAFRNVAMIAKAMRSEKDGRDRKDCHLLRSLSSFRSLLSFSSLSSLQSNSFNLSLNNFSAILPPFGCPLTSASAKRAVCFSVTLAGIGGS